MYIAILGRQPALGMAELEQCYGSHATRWFADAAVIVKTDSLDIERLGGTQKAGRVVLQLKGDWRHVSQTVIKHYTDTWSGRTSKVTLGISVYGFTVNPRDVQRVGILIKSALKNSSGSVRLIPNTDAALNTATSHHNKLGLSDNKVELLIVRGTDGGIIVAESVGAQNITSLARRDQGRPKRDAFVGMLPPKLALMMVNMAIGPHTSQNERGLSENLSSEAPTPSPNASSETSDSEETVFTQTTHDAKTVTILDPFCGTGVILQEALLLGYRAYGTDLADKMIDYSRINLDWLTSLYRLPADAYRLETGDAMTHHWSAPISAIASEAYLGQPFSAPPSPAKLAEVVGNCDRIISTFLRNLAPQIATGTPLCLAVPAWRDTHGTFTHLPLINTLKALGYELTELRHVRPEQLLYYRESQVVARQILLLTRA